MSTLEILAVAALGFAVTYFGPFIWAYRTGLHTPKDTARGLIPLVIGGVGIALIFANTYGLIFPFAMLVIIPIFLFGLGRVLGNLTALLHRIPLLQAMVAAAALGWPLLVGYEVYSAHQNRNDKTLEYIAKLNAFQQTTIKGRIGRHPITLPVSPQIASYYTCFPSDRDIAGQCRTNFRFDTSLRDLKGNAPVFDKLVFATNLENCHTARCIDFESIKAWCKTRPDLAFTDWCQVRQTPEFTFDYDENRGDEQDDRNWQAINVLDQVDVTLECITNQGQRDCRVRYEIARNLRVQIWLVDIDDADMKAKVEASQAAVARIWDEMQPN